MADDLSDAEALSILQQVGWGGGYEQCMIVPCIFLIQCAGSGCVGGGGGDEDGSLTRASEQKIDVIAADVGGSGAPVLRKKAVWQVSICRVISNRR